MSTEYRSSANRRVVVAEDDGMVAEAICDRLTDAGYEVVARPDSGAGAVEAALALRPDVILMDVRLKGEIDGIRASELINEKMRVPVVYLTGDSDAKTLARARAASAYGYVLKPFHIRNLTVAIEVALDRFEMERRLEDSQLTYETILGSIADGVIAVDTESRVRFMNGVAERLTGWPLQEAERERLGKVLSIVNPGGEDSMGLAARVLNSRAASSLGRDASVISRSGAPVPVDGEMSCVLDGSGRVVGASITLRDVTSSRRTESELRMLAQQLRAVVDTAADGVLLFGATGDILMLNPACERLFGYPPGEMIGRNIESLMPSPLSGVPEGPTGRQEVGRPIAFAARATICRRRDRSTFPAEVSVGEAHSPGHPLFVGVVHDVSERRALEAAFLDAVGREQRRFAIDLHDGLGQELTGLSLILSALTDAARATRSPHAKDLEKAGDVVRHALQSCGAIARGLSPIAPTEGGLIGALRHLVTRLKTPSGPRVDISVSEVSRLGLSAAASEHLYRIAQEALANALKHSHANAIKVRLDVEPANVRLEICDDGDGLAASAISAGGLGLRTMRYRASLLGGSFRITRSELAGTCVVCECPTVA